METYKKRSNQNEAQIIQHIKSISKDLFYSNSPEKDNYFNHRYKDGKEMSPLKQFIKTSKKEAVFNEYKPRPNTQSMLYLSSTLPHSRSKSKKKPIFANFDEFWNKCSQSPQKKQMTPIMEQINRNIYSRFKTEAKVGINFNQNILNSTQREEHWSNFLKRQQDWDRERKNSKRQFQMKAISRQSPQIKKRVRTNSNVDYKDVQADKQMSEVQKSITQLRLQTQRLRLKILKIDNGPNYTKENSKKFYSNK